MKIKNLLWIILICLFPFSLLAQLEKGNTTLGGNAGLNYYFEDGSDLLEIQFAPVKTWMVTDQIEIGTGLGLNYNFVDGFSGGFYQLRPMFNYYFNPDSEGLNFFAGAEVGLLGGLGDIDGDIDLSLGLNVGALCFMNPNTAFQTKLVYRFIDSEFGNTNVIGVFADLKAFMDVVSAEEEESSAIGQSTLLIGGSSAGIAFSFYDDGGNNENETIINLNPMALFMLTEQLGIGGSLNIGYSSNEFIDDRFDFGLVPEARYYFKPLTNQSGPQFFGTVNAGIMHMSIGDFDETDLQLGLGVGADIFIAQNVAIEGVLSYGYSDQTFNVANRIGANFMVQYFWNQ